MSAVTLPVQAVGGLRLDDLLRLPAAGAPLVVVGAPLVIDPGAERASEGDDERRRACCVRSCGPSKRGRYNRSAKDRSPGIAGVMQAVPGPR